MRRKVVEEKGAVALVGLVRGGSPGEEHAASKNTAILVEAAWCLRLLTEDLITRRKVCVSVSVCL